MVISSVSFFVGGLTREIALFAAERVEQRLSGPTGRGDRLRTAKSAAVAQHLPERSGMDAMKYRPHLPAFHGTSAPQYFFHAVVETSPAFLGSTLAPAGDSITARTSFSFSSKAPYSTPIWGTISASAVGNTVPDCLRTCTHNASNRSACAGK